METEFVRWLRDRVPTHSSLLLGPGDDAAILQWQHDANCVVTTDLLTDQVDFDVQVTPLEKVGRKALAVNLSDLAAMAAKPVAIVISLALPRHQALKTAQQIYEGLLPLASEWAVAVAGGDTNCWNGPLAISVTAIGQVTAAGVLRRDGAVAGDQILVTGEFGGSILGKHLDFNPRVSEALYIRKQFEVHAGMDVSDGLSLDLFRMMTESGCGAELDLAAIPIADAAHELAKSTDFVKTPLQHALADGEDFELVIALPPAEAERLLAQPPDSVPVTRIGHCTEQPGLYGVDDSGQRAKLSPAGYTH